MLLRNQAAEFLGANTDSFYPAQMDLDITDNTRKIEESVMNMDRASLVTFLRTVGFKGFSPEISKQQMCDSFMANLHDVKGSVLFSNVHMHMQKDAQQSQG